MARRGSGWEAVPLVGPGSELQLTLDGRAVPHHEVVAALERPSAPPGPPAPRAAERAA